MMKMSSSFPHFTFIALIILILIQGDCREIDDEIIETTTKSLTNQESLPENQKASSGEPNLSVSTEAKNESLSNLTRHHGRRHAIRSQSVDRSIDESTDESTDQSIDRSIDQKSKAPKRGSRIKPLLTALDKLKNMSKHAIQLSRKMSSRTMKNFKLLKANLKKVASSLNQTKNNSEAPSSPAPNPLTTTPDTLTTTPDPLTTTPDPITTKGPGIKRSAQGSSFLCPSEFVGGGSWTSCYKLSTLRSTWYEARSYCNSLGADLLSLETLKEAYIVDYLIKSNGMSSRKEHQQKPQDNLFNILQSPQSYLKTIHQLSPYIMSDDLSYWTSATRASVGGNWMWSSRTELKPLIFSRWQSGRPDSFYSKKCMISRYDNKIGSTWSNVYCNEEYKFICEANMEQNTG